MVGCAIAQAAQKSRRGWLVYRMGRKQILCLLFFGGAAPGTFRCPNLPGRWHCGESSTDQRRAAEKQKEVLRGRGAINRPPTLGFWAITPLSPGVAQFARPFVITIV